jgi:hypothetical protein
MTAQNGKHGLIIPSLEEAEPEETASKVRQASG